MRSYSNLQGSILNPIEWFFIWKVKGFFDRKLSRKKRRH
jgi:hypothetical protein